MAANVGMDRKAVTSLNERTLVNGRNVSTTPITKELGLSPEQLSEALANLVAKGWVTLDANGDATMTPEGHLHVTD